MRISGEIMNLRYSYGGCENGRSRGCERGKMRYSHTPVSISSSGDKREVISVGIGGRQVWGLESQAGAKE